MAWASRVIVFGDSILPEHDPHAAFFLLVFAVRY
jgi:hypothetical protein